MIHHFLILPLLVLAAGAAHAYDVSSGYTLSITLERETYAVDEPIEGTVTVRSTKSGFPVTFNVTLYHEDELRSTKHVHFPTLYMGSEEYSLETFGITSLNEPGLWRIEIGSPGLEPEAVVEIEIVDKEASH